MSTAPNIPIDDQMADCTHAAAWRVEGYSPDSGRLHGSLDVAVYACDAHAALARGLVLAAGLAPHTGAPLGPAARARCGDSWLYRECQR